MTSNATNEATYAYDTTSFNAANTTITAQFNYTSFNGTGADGLTFFLANATTVASGFTPGAYGGSLGYAQKTIAGGGGVDQAGLTGGYLGIGIDEYGNYSNPTEGRSGGPGFVPNAIAVRGPGNGTTGYDYLGGTGTLATALSSPGSRNRPAQNETIQMVLSATNQLTVSIEYAGTNVFVPVFTADLSAYARPASLVMGFTAGTGGLTATQQIQDVTLSAYAANIWSNGGGTSTWGTGANWVGSPGVVPPASSDVLLNNSVVSTAQTISVASNRVVRSLQIDAPFTYTLNGGSIEFNNGGNAGPSGIIVTGTSGSAVQTINSNITADNAVQFQNSTSQALNLGGTLANGGNSVSFTGSGTVNVSGVVSGTGAIYQTGAGTTNLSGANTYSGGTTITAGVLNANSSTALGTGTVNLSGGTLGSTNGSTISNAITLSASSGLSGITSGGKITQTGGSYTLNMSGATQTGAVALTNNTTARTLTTEVDSGTSTISGVISDGGTGSGLTKTGAGTLALGGVNTYTGLTTVSAGTLQTNIAGALAAGATVSVSSGAVFNLNGNNQTIQALNNAGTLAMGSSALTTLNLGSGTTGTSTFSGGSITGSGTLVINKGMTLVLGANFNDPNLAIELNGGTLKFSGGYTDVFGSLSVTQGSSIDFGGHVGSVLEVNGLSVSGGTLAVNNWSNANDYFYSLTNPGSSLSQVTFAGYAGPVHWNSYDSGPLSGQEITPAPEPATYGAIFVAVSLAGVVLYRRRRTA